MRKALLLIILSSCFIGFSFTNKQSHGFDKYFHSKVDSIAYLILTKYGGDSTHIYNKQNGLKCLDYIQNLTGACPKFESALSSHTFTNKQQYEKCVKEWEKWYNENSTLTIKQADSIVLIGTLCQKYIDLYK